MQANEIAVKCSSDGEFRRFTVADTISFSILKVMLCNLFRVDDVTVKYVDDEGDQVTIASDDELKEAIRQMDQHKRILRILVVAPKRVTSTATTTTTSTPPSPAPVALMQATIESEQTVLDQFRQLIAEFCQTPTVTAPPVAPVDTPIPQAQPTILQPQPTILQPQQPLPAPLIRMTPTAESPSNPTSGHRTVAISNETAQGVSKLAEDIASVTSQLSAEIATLIKAGVPISNALAQQTADCVNNLVRITSDSTNSLSQNISATTMQISNQIAQLMVQQGTAAKSGAALSRQTSDAVHSLAKETSEKTHTLSQNTTKDVHESANEIRDRIMNMKL